MDAVAGVVQLDDGRASSRDLDKILQAMRHWGSASAQAVADDLQAGGVASRLSSSETRLSDGTVVAVAARLDNREEIAGFFQTGSERYLNLSDDLLVVRAFERWGQACVEHLNGDWSLAAWSPRERRLFLARDHFGNTGLYVARSGARVAFASDLPALLSLPWLSCTLDEERLASLLVGGGVAPATSTIYREVRRIPPAYRATFSRDGDRFDRYWCVEELPQSDAEDQAERPSVLRDTLRLSVRSRLNSSATIGSMLSGGLDSGGVTALAAEYLQTDHRRLTAFTAVPAADSSSEGPAAAEVVKVFDSIDHVLVDSRFVSPIAGVRRGLSIQGEPLVAAANYGWITAILNEAQSRGIQTVLTGQVGDFVMRGRPAGTGWRTGWSAGNYRAIAKQMLPNWSLRLRQSGWKPWRLTQSPWKPFSVVNEGFAADVRLIERMRDAGRDPNQLKPTDRSNALATIRTATSDNGAIWSALGAAFGLTIVDPLQDKRVMELMFSWPRPANGGAVDRWLFRQSLAGVLPKPVRLSRRKGVQSSDIVERLRATWGEVLEVLDLAEASPLARRCLDLPYCRDLARSIAEAPDPIRVRRNAFVLMNGLAAALFLAESAGRAWGERHS